MDKTEGADKIITSGERDGIEAVPKNKMSVALWISLGCLFLSILCFFFFVLIKPAIISNTTTRPTKPVVVKTKTKTPKVKTVAQSESPGSEENALVTSNLEREELRSKIYEDVLRDNQTLPSDAPWYVGYWTSKTGDYVWIGMPDPTNSECLYVLFREEPTDNEHVGRIMGYQIVPKKDRPNEYKDLDGVLIKCSDPGHDGELFYLDPHKQQLTVLNREDGVFTKTDKTEAIETFKNYAITIKRLSATTNNKGVKNEAAAIVKANPWLAGKWEVNGNTINIKKNGSVLFNGKAKVATLYSTCIRLNSDDYVVAEIDFANKVLISQ